MLIGFEDNLVKLYMHSMSYRVEQETPYNVGQACGCLFG